MHARTLITSTSLAWALALAPALAPAPALAQDRGGGAVRLIASDLQGQVVWVDDAVEDLRSLGFNDSASHVEIRSGRWELCPDGGYNGACRVFGPGRHELPPDLRNRLSSLRPVGPGGAGGGPLPVPGRPQPVGRADVVLYEHPDFSGRRLLLDDAVRNLADRDFNDQTSAVDIQRGRWAFCRHADFGGDCVVLGPGRHALGRNMQDEVSSVRRVDGSDPGGSGGGGWRPGGPEASVTLYDGDGRRSQPLRVNEAVAHLRELDFNDRAQWVEVHQGRWELCSGARFRGTCVTYGPGRHRLPPALAGQLSSLRPR